MFVWPYLSTCKPFTFLTTVDGVIVVSAVGKSVITEAVIIPPTPSTQKSPNTYLGFRFFQSFWYHVGWDLRLIFRTLNVIRVSLEMVTVLAH